MDYIYYGEKIMILRSVFEISSSKIVFSICEQLTIIDLYETLDFRDQGDLFCKQIVYWIVCNPW